MGIVMMIFPIIAAAISAFSLQFTPPRSFVNKKWSICVVLCMRNRILRISAQKSKISV